MKRCAALTKGGSRCQRIASDGSDYCYSHDPAMADERCRNAQRAGQAGGRGRSGAGASAELVAVKKRLRQLAEDVMAGRADRGDAAVAGQLLGTYLRALSVGSKLKEVLELEERIHQLEEAERGGASWAG
jgi:hypothetical protein